LITRRRSSLLTTPTTVDDSWLDAHSLAYRQPTVMFYLHLLWICGTTSSSRCAAVDKISTDSASCGSKASCIQLESLSLSVMSCKRWVFFASLISARMWSLLSSSALLWYFITPHSFIPGLNLSFSANPSHRSLSFLLQDWLRAFPGLFTDTSEHIRFFLISFSVFHFLLVPCGRLSWFMSAFDCTLLYCIVSYRMDRFIDYTVSQKNKTPNSCP